MNALMNASRFNLRPTRDLTHEVNRWMNEMTDDLTRGGNVLPASIWENDTHIYLEFDMPGVNTDDVDVKVRENVLQISATRPLKSDVHFVVQERRFGTFHRHFTLPSRVDGSAITAEMQDGILSVEVPKAEEAKVRKIEVKAL